MATLFANGRRQTDLAAKKAIEKKTVVKIKYYAPQIVGDDDEKPIIRSGAKLIARLLTAIDTRTSSLVRAEVAHDSEAHGVEIERGSILVGHHSYTGSGDRVTLSFSRIDFPGGKSKSISAQALDARDFMAGVIGDQVSDGGVKVASSLGLTMFSGMTDTLTDRESLGNSYYGVQAKPSMKNALLQGLSHASQDQASRTASSIGAERDYVVVPEGKEMIIELNEDFNDRTK